jgi:acyl-coenzyme A thioesterase PaaI-like protein
MQRADAKVQSRARRFLQRPFYKFINFYGPFMGAGIRVVHTSPDYRTVRVEMKLRWYNRNAVGTHFGGSLYAMCDPFFMLLMMHHMGNEYVIWDKAADIQFVRPARGTVHADFHLPAEIVDGIRARADRGEKVEPTFAVDIVDEEGQVVARVEKLLYVRKKNAPRAESRPDSQIPQSEVR